MAAVQVTILNKSNQKVSLTLDDETDAEQIEYFHTLKRREDLVDVEVTPVKARRQQGKPAGDTGDAS
ncbi:hypothetical protein [Mycobacterium sp. D16R24]|uniref:hypothetical protein n=1 Tax=Mycobacterium sp. D16R24 TaxID=1855656 RepID=UPI000993391F|nr:hypothetical protein [Mycobacterium sp. D16R24]